MSSVALPSSHSHWRLLTAGALLPAIFVAIDSLLLDCVSGRWQPDWTMTLTMSLLVVQIGVMGVLCGRWIELRSMRWILYLWCWLLIDFQAIVAWVYTDQTSWWGSSFQPASLFTAQLGLLLIWSVLGAARWTVRLPIAVVVGCALLLFLGRVRYEYQSAAGLIVMQLAMLGTICWILQRKGFRVVVLGRDSEAFRRLGAGDLRVGQFGVRDVLIWMTALGLACGLVRWFGVPWNEWLQSNARSWVPLITGGVALSVTLVLALWAALGPDESRGRRYRVLLFIPLLAIGAGLVEWLFWYLHYQPWTAPWYGRETWQNCFYWSFWSPFKNSSQFTMTWLCLAGGMLFAALLFPRELGYRLVRRRGGDKGGRD